MIYNTTFPPSELKKSNMIKWKISTFTANSTPEEKLNFQIHRVDFVVLKIWCYYMATVFALEHPGVFNHQSNDALLHLIEQTSKYDLSLQLVRTYVHLVLKIQNHLYVNTLTLNQHSQICEVTVCFETSRWHMCQLRKKIYMKLTFPSTRSKIGSKIIGVMTMVKRFRTLNTRLRMFRHPFLDGRRSDGADAMTVYRDTLKFDQRMLTLKKSPRSACPHKEFCPCYVCCFLILEEDENYQLLF